MPICSDCSVDLRPHARYCDHCGRLQPRRPGARADAAPRGCRTLRRDARTPAAPRRPRAAGAAYPAQLRLAIYLLAFIAVGALWAKVLPREAAGVASGAFAGAALLLGMKSGAVSPFAARETE